MASITFVGGADSVTGSKFLVEHDGARVLVDCGLYQGPKALRLRNWAEPPVDPASIDAVVVTHAHLDHVGYLPRLAAGGFDGTVHATSDTVALAEIVLPDSGHLQEEEARYANRRGYSKHSPALPLYSEREARRVLSQFRRERYRSPFEPASGILCELTNAGHILGSATVNLTLGDETRVTVSGDLGPDDHPLLRPPDPLRPCDVLLCESTYGGRQRPDEDVGAVLASIIDDTVAQSGVVLIPAFSVDRTEIVLWHLAELRSTGRIPTVPVFLDSPMASAALAVYRRAAETDADDLRPEIGPELFRSLDLVESRTVDESKALNERRGPMIIISASGMVTGGRILHHLAARSGDPRNSIVLVGFQAPATRGRALADGARSIKFFGSYHHVRARVHRVGLSAHADERELVGWVGSADELPGTVFAVHGEPDRSAALCSALDRELGAHAVSPGHGERVIVDAAGRGAPERPSGQASAGTISSRQGRWWTA